MRESDDRTRRWRALELVALTAAAFLLANILLVQVAVRDASWLALGIQALFSPFVNLALGACAISVQHWGPGRDLPARAGRFYKVAVLCAIVVAIGVDFALIEAVPKHGC
jgi:hypothetical protein